MGTKLQREGKCTLIHVQKHPVMDFFLHLSGDTIAQGVFQLSDCTRDQSGTN